MQILYVSSSNAIFQKSVKISYLVKCSLTKVSKNLTFTTAFTNLEEVLERTPYDQKKFKTRRREYSQSLQNDTDC